MKPTRKSGKGGGAKGPAKQNAVRTRPRGSAATGCGKPAYVLNESSEMFKFLIEATNTGYVILDGRGRVLDANQEYVRLTGHDSLEEIAGRAVTEWTAAYDRERSADEVRRCLESGSVRNLVIDYIGLNGRVTPVEINATMLEGAPSPRIFTVCWDITERKRADEEIRMLKHSIDVHYDGAYWMDSDNKFVYVNDAGCEALGYRREELIGQSITKVNPTASDEVMKKVWAGLRAGKAFSSESVHRRKDGSEFPVEIVTTYVRFGGKEYACGFARDITDRQRAERALKESQRFLETIIESAPT